MIRPAACFLGLDLGTSAVRAAAIDERGETLALTRASLPAPHRRRHQLCQDPEIWWQAGCAAILQLIEQVPNHRPVALAVDGTSGTLLAADSSGAPLGEALMYNHASPPELVARIAALAPRESAAHGASSAASSALELLDRFPRTAWLLHQADWVLGRLLGEPGHSDENNLLKLGYDPIQRRWPDWLPAAGIPNHCLPRAHAPGRPIGKLCKDAARATGLASGLLLVAGTTDSTASFLATGAREPGDGVTTLGSTLVVKLLSHQPIFAPGHGIYSHRLDQLWLAGGASNSGGAVLLQHFTAEEIARLTPELRPEQPTGLDYYPLCEAGERFPIHDPTLTPRLTPVPTEPARFLQGMLEGMARIEQLGYQRLVELGADTPRQVFTTGGGAVNQPWTCIRRTLLELPLLPSLRTEAAFGSAELARQGALYGSLVDTGIRPA